MFDMMALRRSRETVSTIGANLASSLAEYHICTVLLSFFLFYAEENRRLGVARSAVTHHETPGMRIGGLRAFGANQPYAMRASFRL
jgi:hypothetical protein